MGKFTKAELAEIKKKRKSLVELMLRNSFKEASEIKQQIESGNRKNLMSLEDFLKEL